MSESTKTVSTKTVHVRYFAALREQRGVSNETLTTSAANALQLYSELAEKHGFNLDAAMLKVAINDRFGSWDCRLQEADTVVFLPPVAGG